jgi:hypothetical protein
MYGRDTDLRGDPAPVGAGIDCARAKAPAVRDASAADVESFAIVEIDGHFLRLGVLSDVST